MLSYISMCSGIESASAAAHPLGWKPVAFSEIEPFPSAVLAHHYPDVPNLGDMTAVDWAAYKGKADVVVAGTPCQAFSVAGARRGLADERGQLTSVWLDSLDAVKPEWVVWENVPGVLSIDDGKVLEYILERLNDAGYAVEADILDAQHFGVPQRRRRVFLVCHHVQTGRTLRSRLFVSTALCWMIETLLSVLAAHLKQLSACGSASESQSPVHGRSQTSAKKKTAPSKNAGWSGMTSGLEPFLDALLKPSKSGAKSFSFIDEQVLADGLRRKMRLLGMPSAMLRDSGTCSEAWSSLLRDLGEALAKYQHEPGNSDSASAPLKPERMNTGAAPASCKTGAGCSSTKPLWNDILGVVCDLASMSITSTATREITASTIYTCAQVLLSIAESITKLTDWSKNCSAEASHASTALKGFMSYARQANSVFSTEQPSGIDWLSFEESAAAVIRAIGRRSGDRADPRAILFESEGVRRDTAPSRKAGKDVAPSFARSPAFGGNTAGALDVTGTMCAKDGRGNHSDIVSKLIPVQCVTGDVTHTLKADGFDASEDGTGRGQPIVPVAFQSSQSGVRIGETHATLDANNGPRRHNGAITADLRVRRLTPTECERLMGYVDGYTNVTYRNKPAADGPRYKALGNSKAVPVVNWIFRRIARAHEQALMELLTCAG
jgi:DNA-cytosine methyltransferase